MLKRIARCPQRTRRLLCEGFPQQRYYILSFVQLSWGLPNDIHGQEQSHMKGWEHSTCSVIIPIEMLASLITIQKPLYTMISYRYHA